MGDTSLDLTRINDSDGVHRTRDELDLELARAANVLLQDYLLDKELTAFTVLDGEDFLQSD